MKKFDELLEQTLNGLAKGQSLTDLAKKHDVPLSSIKKEFVRGRNVELEHTKPKNKKASLKNKKAAERIAKDHLSEDPKYYTKLDKIEKK